MNKSLPITFIIHKSLPIIQSILTKIFFFFSVLNQPLGRTVSMLAIEAEGRCWAEKLNASDANGLHTLRKLLKKINLGECQNNTKHPCCMLRRSIVS